jgi:hypothetical protein
MLIRTSAPGRQIERMLEKRDWRRRLASRQAVVTVIVPPVETIVSAAAALELGLAKQVHRPARAEKATTRAPILSNKFQLHSLRRHPEEETAAR